MTGGAVSGPVILGGAGPEHFSGSVIAGAVVAALARRLRLVRGGLAAHARARGAGRGAARRARRAADRAPLRLPPRPALARGASPFAGPRSGCGSATRTSSSSPATCSRIRGAAPASTRRCAAWTRTSCSGTTTSPSRAIRSRARRSSTGSRRRCSRTSRSPSSGAASGSSSSGIAPLPDGGGAALRIPSASLRILLCHYPTAARPRAIQLVLAGHMHAGQIVLPYPGGKIRFAHSARG